MEKGNKIDQEYQKKILNSLSYFKNLVYLTLTDKEIKAIVMKYQTLEFRICGDVNKGKMTILKDE